MALELESMLFHSDLLMTAFGYKQTLVQAAGHVRFQALSGRNSATSAECPLCAQERTRWEAGTDFRF